MKDNIFFILAHPIDTLKVKVRQLAVSIEHASPPTSSSFEEFPGLSVQEAAKLMGLTKSSTGIQLEDWPISDQKRMEAGLKPLGHPEHTNV